MQVYDRNGKPVEIPDEQATEALSSGQYGLPKGASVPIVTKDGRLGKVSAEEAHAAFADGAKVAPAAQVAQARQQAKYGGTGGQLAAAGLGALSGASLGASDALIGAVGGRGAQDYLEGVKQANPVASTVGEIGGAIAPALLGDEAGLAGAAEEAVEGANAARGLAEGAEGASALAKAGGLAKGAAKVVSAPSRAVGSLGRSVETAVADILGGEGGSLASRMAKHIIAKGTAGAAEGAAFGLGQELSEESLGDADLNGEKLLAAAGHGALLGLGAGAGLTAAGEIGSRVLGRVAPKLGGMAEEGAVRLLEPHVAGARELERIPGGARAAGRQMLDDGLIQAGDRLEDVAPRIAKAREEAGKAVGAVYDAADQAGFHGPSVRSLTDTLERDALADLRKLPSVNAPAIRKIEDAIADLHTFGGVPTEAEAFANGVDRATVLENAKLTFRQAQEFKSTLGKSINWKRSPFPGVEDKANEALKDVYKAVSQEIDAAGEKAAKGLGGSFSEDLRAANRKYQTYSALDRIAQNSTRLAEGRNIASPSTKGFGMASMLGAAAHGAGGPVSLATGLASAFAHHVMQERGTSTAAVILDKLAALRGVERAAQTVDRQMDRGVAALLKEPGRAEAEVRIQPHPYRDHVMAVRQAKAGPEAHRADVEQAVAPVAPHAPRTAAAFSSAAVRATTYLASQAPKDRAPPSLTPHLDAPRASRADEQRYELQAQAVHDPVSVLKDLASGKATVAQVDAFKATYPKMFAELQQKLQAKLAERTKPLDYEQKKQLAMIFGPAAGPEFDPKFMARMQQDFAVEGAAQGGAGGKPRGAAPKRKLDSGADRLRLGGS